MLLFDNIINRSVSASYTSTQCTVASFFLIWNYVCGAWLLSSAFFSFYILQWH